MDDQTGDDAAELEAFLSKALLAYRLSDTEGRTELLQLMLMARLQLASARDPE